jgi:hypothetical protein
VTHHGIPVVVDPDILAVVYIDVYITATFIHVHLVITDVSVVAGI